MKQDEQSSFPTYDKLEVSQWHQTFPLYVLAVKQFVTMVEKQNGGCDMKLGVQQCFEVVYHELTTLRRVYFARAALAVRAK